MPRGFTSLRKVSVHFCYDTLVRASHGLQSWGRHGCSDRVFRRLWNLGRWHGWLVDGAIFAGVQKGPLTWIGDGWMEEGLGSDRSSVSHRGLETDVLEQFRKWIWPESILFASPVLSIVLLQQYPRDRTLELSLDICLLTKFEILVKEKYDAVVWVNGRWVYWKVKGTDMPYRRVLIKTLATERGELLQLVRIVKVLSALSISRSLQWAPEPPFCAGQ